MEVDSHPETGVSSTGSGTLKRCSSAPMIPALVAAENQQPVSLPLSPALDTSRHRHLSSSSLNLANPPSHNTVFPSPHITKSTDRIHQIKREESAIVREEQHEREVQSAMVMSQTLDDFSLDEPMVGHMESAPRRPRSFSESLHIFTSPTVLCSSPSPTRIGKQCYSPSMQMPVKNHSFSPSPSPSPTRKTYHRSLSPIAVRPSILGKRKMEDESHILTSNKRFSFGLQSTPDRLLTCVPHPLANSVSSGSQGEESSPEVVHPTSSLEHLHPQHSKLDCFSFTPVREQTEMTTDSETSDIAEFGDISESTRHQSTTSLTSQTLSFQLTNNVHLPQL